jgi:hypothetical protein
MAQLKKYPTVGACGLDCGLCPRFYTVGPSRCPGCGGPEFAAKHPSCSFITCCVKTMGLEVCGQCSEFPCPKFKSEEQYRRLDVSSSYPPCTRLLSNNRLVRQQGLRPFLRQQQQRIALLRRMIDGFDDGRSRSYCCRAAALLDPGDVRASLSRARTAAAADAGARDKARGLRTLLADVARRTRIELSPRSRHGRIRG